MTSTPKFNIEIISDNVCPWCFVGKRNLENAMKKFSSESDQAPAFTVVWKPFFLDHTSPDTSSEPILVHLENKYGKGAGSRMATALDQAGAQAGIKFNNDRRVHNTIKSHRLVRLAHEQGRGDDMIEVLFHAYFELGQNIADTDILLGLAQQAGVECSKDYLDGDDGRAEVLTEYKEATKSDHVTGVPFFKVSHEGTPKSVQLSGAQPPSAFMQAFHRLASAS